MLYGKTIHHKKKRSYIKKLKYIKTKTNKHKYTKTKTQKHKRKMNQHNGGTILGQGTHGTIIIDPLDPSKVIKMFVKMSNCAKLQDEYVTQNTLSNEFEANNLNIVVPKPCCYSATRDHCKYTMTRIYPFPKYNYYLLLNFAEPNLDKKFNHSTVGYEVGIVPLIDKYKINVHDTVFVIGKMFSYLHYVRMMDGYDCEAIIGSSPEDQTAPTLFLIDFDKIQTFEFKLGITVYRKIDEQTIDEKILSNAPKFARFLFGAFISMSLLPTNYELKQIFIDGYRTYLPNKELQKDIFERVVREIEDYQI